MATTARDTTRARFARPAAAVTGVAIVVLTFVLAYVVNNALSLRPGPNEYNLPAWEARNFANKWLYALGHPFGDGRSTDQQDRDLTAFLDSVGRIANLEQQGDSAALESEIATRDRLENRVEATIESRISWAARQAGITRDLGLFHVLWPPVDLEFTTPPRSLAVSPRDQIKLISSKLLREGLDLPQVEQIEQQTEAKGDVSALAFPISGVGAYPTIVAYDSDYGDLLRIVAHEWTHNYLAFRPLGLHYFKNNDVRTINESVADLVGKELAAMVQQRWPLQASQPQQSTRPPASGIDLRTELIQLRGQVEVLLAQGKIDEAERLMEEKRQYLAANGYYYRKINQAFFAFTNLYAGEAGSPAAVNPIGPKIDDLRRRAGSLSRFLAIVGGVTSVNDLDRALAELGGR
jgi:hypothetical protein